jgi:hypothetical protein
MTELSAALTRRFAAPSPRGRGLVAWQASVVDILRDLGRWTDGRYAAELPADAEVASAEQYVDPATLRNGVLRIYSANVKQASPTTDHGFTDEAAPDLRIAISRFTRHAACVSAAALAALGCGVGLDAAAKNCRFIIRGNVPFIAHLASDGAPPVRCRERETSWPLYGPVVETLAELREYVWRGLYAGWLAPLFERAGDITRVSPRLMWTNAAEWVSMVSNAADEYLGPERAAPFVEDRVALFSAETLPGVPGPNPMQDLIEWQPYIAPDFPHGVERRRICCMTYMLSDRLGRLCSNCPFLSLEERVALVREEHGQPMGSPGGPAQRRAIEAGLRKLGT